jgi:hypothetical protein
VNIISSTGALASCVAVAERPVSVEGQPSAPAATRSLEMTFRISVHEAGHVVCARYFDLPVGGSTIVASGRTGGLTWGASEQLDRAAFDESAVHGVDDDILETARALRPMIGESFTPAAEWHQRCRVRCIGALAAEEAERILLPDHLPIGGVGDQLQARQFATMFCTSPNSVNSFLEVCRVEAAEIVGASRHIVLALAYALVEHRTLDGGQIDDIIAQAVVERTMADEKLARAEWRARIANAAKFVSDAAS